MPVDVAGEDISIRRVVDDWQDGTTKSRQEQYRADRRYIGRQWTYLCHSTRFRCLLLLPDGLFLEHLLPSRGCLPLRRTETEGHKRERRACLAWQSVADPSPALSSEIGLRVCGCLYQGSCLILRDRPTRSAALHHRAA